MGPLLRDGKPHFTELLPNSHLLARYIGVYGQNDGRLAFKQRPVQLEYGAARKAQHKTPPTFDEISIELPKIYNDGIGDLMSALKLAEGLKREFPDKKVVIYFGSKEDYALLGKLYPDFDAAKTENQLNGVKVVCCGKALGNALKGKDIVIAAHLKLDMQDAEAWDLTSKAAENFFRKGMINFYLPEYDCEHLVCYPEDMRINQATIDRVGNLHTILTTGFGQGSIGIHIDETLARIGKSPQKRAEYLRQLLAGRELPFADSLVERKWGMDYLPITRKPNRTCYSSLVRAWAARKDVGTFGPGLIFDFKSYDCVESWREYVRVRDPLNMLFLHVLVGQDGIQTMGNPDSSVMFLSPGSRVPHGVFLGVMAQCDLPVYITGDASLSEAVSMDKLFFYDARSHKDQLIGNLLKQAERGLAEEDSVLLKRVLEYHHPKDLRLLGMSLDEMDRAHITQQRYEQELMAQASELFDLAPCQDAMHRLNRFIQDNLDLAKNLAGLIREAICSYTKMHP